MLQCYSRPICGNWCDCCIKERHLKNYKKSIRDEKGMIHNKFFIFGQDSNNISFVNFYDHASKKLIDLPINEDIRNYSGTTMIDANRIFICGGVNIHMNNVVAHAKIYNISKETFTALPRMFNIRFNFAVLHFKGKVFVTGGRAYGPNDVAIMNQCEYYDIGENKWFQMPSMNVQRCGHQMFAYKNKIYVIGGLSIDKRARFLEEYNPITNTWRLTSKSMVFDLYNFEIFSHQPDELLIIGGLHSKGYSNFIHSFNMKESRINTVGFLKYQRSNFKLFYERTKQRLILMGGAISQGTNPLQTYLETFDLINQKSTTIPIDSSLRLVNITKYNYNKPSIVLVHSPNQNNNKIQLNSK
jgi:hypothetical protein